MLRKQKVQTPGNTENKQMKIRLKKKNQDEMLKLQKWLKREMSKLRKQIEDQKNITRG